MGREDDSASGTFHPCNRVRVYDITPPTGPKRIEVVNFLRHGNQIPNSMLSVSVVALVVPLESVTSKAIVYFPVSPTEGGPVNRTYGPSPVLVSGLPVGGEGTARPVKSCAVFSASAVRLPVEKVLTSVTVQSKVIPPPEVVALA